LSNNLNQLVQETQITESFGTFISWFNWNILLYRLCLQVMA